VFEGHVGRDVFDQQLDAEEFLRFGHLLRQQARGFLGGRQRQQVVEPFAAGMSPAGVLRDQRRLDAIPGIGEWTIAHLNLFGRGRYDVPLAKDVGMRNAYARVAGVRTGSVTEAEFAAVLNRYQPFQGLAAMYLVAAGWRSGAWWS